MNRGVSPKAAAYAALDRRDTFTIDELREAFRSLPLDGLADVASALSRGMEGAGNQRDFYWTNRIAPFWRDVWPKTPNTSPRIAEDLFRLCVGADMNFPAALDSMKPWLVPVPHPEYLVHLLSKSRLCERFPEGALEWLNVLIDAQRWPPTDLEACLNAISTAAPTLTQDPRYIRLIDYLHQRRT